MKKIGITGGIGSGKSTICEIFSSLGVPIYDADKAAKLLMNTNSSIKENLISAFGSNSYKNGLINRSFLAEKVFIKGENIQVLNAIVHPQVAQDFKLWTVKQKSPYIIKEAALLIESESYRSLDILINITAPINTRIKRVLKRDSFRSEEEIQGIIDKQLSEEERNRIADFIIENDETKLVIPQVLKLHRQFS